MKARLPTLVFLTVTALAVVHCGAWPIKRNSASFARVPAQFNSEKVRVGFQKYCAGCHEAYSDAESVAANRQAIFSRLKWVSDGSGLPTHASDMPQSPMLEEFLKPANREYRLAMVKFVESEARAEDPYPLHLLKSPPGFKVSLWALVPGARSMTLAPDGTLYVGTGGFANPRQWVYRIRDWNRDGKIEPKEVETFIQGLNNPNGVAFRKGSLYVAEIDQILVFDKVNQVPRNSTLGKAQARILPQRFPSDTPHGWKFIRFAPPPNDNWLYVPVGAPCNICRPPNAKYAALHRIDVTSTKQETVARGIRNTVGFDFHPRTGRLWFTDNGRDGLGDEIPPDELNEVKSANEHFGFPYCHGRTLSDPEIRFNDLIPSCEQTSKPALELGPHVAALGMRFYRGRLFPAKFRGQILIAEHGSWNRSKKNGYRITAAFPANGALKYETFISGWLESGTQRVWGRPVDIQELSDGSVLISDDGVPGSANEGAIYRITYSSGSLPN